MILLSIFYVEVISLDDKKKTEKFMLNKLVLNLLKIYMAIKMLLQFYLRSILLFLPSFLFYVLNGGTKKILIEKLF